MTKAVDEVLRRLELYGDGRIYRLLRLPPNAIAQAVGALAEIGSPFCALIADKDELSLMIADERLPALDARLRAAEMSDREYRLITLDVTLEPDLVGFIARVAAALASAGIPVLTYAAYSRDHVFVPAEDFEPAISALHALR